MAGDYQVPHLHLLHCDSIGCRTPADLVNMAICPVHASRGFRVQWLSGELGTPQVPDIQRWTSDNEDLVAEMCSGRPSEAQQQASQTQSRMRGRASFLPGSTP